MHVKAKISLVHVGVHVLFVCFIGIFQLNLRNPSHEAMTPGLVKRLTKSLSATLGFRSSSSVAKVTTGTDLLSIAHNVSLQKALTWDEGVASMPFSFSNHFYPFGSVTITNVLSPRCFSTRKWSYLESRWVIYLHTFLISWCQVLNCGA